MLGLDSYIRSYSGPSISSLSRRRTWDLHTVMDNGPITHNLSGSGSLDPEEGMYVPNHPLEPNTAALTHQEDHNLHQEGIELAALGGRQDPGQHPSNFVAELPDPGLWPGWAACSPPSSCIS